MPAAADSRVVGCVRCGAFNRVSPQQQAEAACGGCGESLEGAAWRRKRLPRLESPQYEHPWDRRALAALEKIPGLGAAVSLFNKHGLDHVIKVEVVGSTMRVTEKNVPELLTALREVLRVLNLSDEPELYVEYGDEINGYTAGVHQPVIVLTTGALESLSRDELYFVLGHEVGHIRSSHLLYSQIALLMPVLGELIGDVTLNLGKLISRGLIAALMHWQRMAELTCDRAGLLACQDVDAGASALVKMAGLPRTHYDRLDIARDTFRQQAVRFDSFDEEWARKLAKLWAVRKRTHPWAVARASQLVQWVEAGDYECVMDLASAAS